MRALFVSDLHLTDRPADAYRWDVFNQLCDLSNEHGVTDLFILGDLTEFKDYHSSRLVNKLVEWLYQLRRLSRIVEIYILKGNHDGLDPALPYFLFLRRFPWCRFYAEPTVVEKGSDTLLFLPHTRDPEQDWKGLEFGTASHIFFHGAVTGAVSESGQKMEGISLDHFRGLRACVLGGDIHVPQVVGKCVEYVGAPYPIRFGDEFHPRALLVDGSKRTSLPLHNIRKITVTVSPRSTGNEFDNVRRGDQVKVLIELSDSELGEFHSIKQAVAETIAGCGGTLSKVQLVRKQSGKPVIGKKSSLPIRATPETELKTFCTRNNVEDGLSEIGHELLKDDQ